MNMEVGEDTEAKLGSDDIFANSSGETVVEDISRTQNVIEDSSQQKRQERELIPITMDWNPTATCSGPMAVKTVADVHVGNEESNTSNVSELAAQCVSEVCTIQRRIYCPFCPLSYAFDFVLQTHIKENHRKELKSSSKIKNRNIDSHPCMFCSAMFYVKDILLKHVLYIHQDAVINMLKCLDFGRAPGQLNCIFCSYSLLEKYARLLIIHIEKKHLTEFEIFITAKASSFTYSPDSGTSNERVSTFKAANPPTPGLSDLVRNLSTKDAGKMQEKYMQKTSKEKRVIKGSPIKKVQKSKNSGRVRRELRFNLPDIESTTGRNKENVIACSTNLIYTGMITKPHINAEKTEPPKSVWFKWGSKRKKPQTAEYSKPTIVTSTPKPCAASNQKGAGFVTSTPITATGNTGEDFPSRVSPGKSFKCGMCSQSYSNNSDLVVHVKKKHNSILNILRPNYTCGYCEAKFYRNSFLVRHCEHHHTPRCLKTKFCG